MVNTNEKDNKELLGTGATKTVTSSRVTPKQKQRQAEAIATYRKRGCRLGRSATTLCAATTVG